MATKSENNSPPSRETPDIEARLSRLESNLELLNKHFDRVVQTVGLVGASIAIVIPLLTVLLTGRSEESLKDELNRFQETIDDEKQNLEKNIESMEKRIGLNSGEPNIDLKTEDGLPLEGATIDAEIRPTYIDEGSSRQSSCSIKTNDRRYEEIGFDECSLYISFRTDNSGDAVAYVDVVRYYTKSLFAKERIIEIDSEKWNMHDFFTESLFYKKIPGFYVATNRSWIHTTYNSESWCSQEDIEEHLGTTLPVIMEYYYHNEAGISKTARSRFNVSIKGSCIP